MDKTSEVEQAILLNNMQNINMKSQFLSFNWTDFKSALVSGLITVLGTALSAVVLYVIGLGNIFIIDWHTLANTGVMAGLVVLVSLLKAYFTTPQGSFAGLVKIK